MSTEMADLVLEDADDKMRKAVVHARAEFATIRTGRASPALVEKLVDGDLQRHRPRRVSRRAHRIAFWEVEDRQARGAHAVSPRIQLPRIPHARFWLAAG